MTNINAIKESAAEMIAFANENNVMFCDMVDAIECEAFRLDDIIKGMGFDEIFDKLSDLVSFEVA